MMSTYAILGATGQVGGSVLEVLGQQPSRQIHCFVRSKAKLEQQRPEICSRSTVKIFEGDISNLDILTDCIRNTGAVFCMVAARNNKPGNRIAQQQVEAVVSVLERIRREEPNARQPVLVMIGSSEAEIEPKISLSVPWPMRDILYAANYYVYTDLIEAEKYLRARECFSVVYVKPGGISHDVQRGHILSEERQQTFVSFLDVAAAMIECADEGDRWGGKCVSVLSKERAKIEWASGAVLLKGLLVFAIPALYPWLF